MIRSFNHVCINAISAAAGKTQYDVAEICNSFMEPAKSLRLIKTLGFSKVRGTSITNTTADLCVKVACDMLNECNVKASDVDAMIFVTQTPDNLVPATSFIMQKKIGLSSDCLLFDITQGCAGFMYGLFQAATLMESKVCKNVLVCVGETACKVDFLDELSQQANVALFGDGVGVALVSYAEDCEEITFSIETNGEFCDVIKEERTAPKLERIRCAIKKGLLSSDFAADGAHISGIELASYAMGNVKQSIINLIESKNLSLDDLSYLLVHQANKSLLKALAVAVGSNPSKVPFLAAQTGNTSSASIPLAICENIELLQDGLKTKPVLLSGFGVGMTVANAILDLSKTKLIKAQYL